MGERVPLSLLSTKQLNDAEQVLKQRIRALRHSIDEYEYQIAKIRTERQKRPPREETGRSASLPG